MAELPLSDSSRAHSEPGLSPENWGWYRSPLFWLLIALAVLEVLSVCLGGNLTVVAAWMWVSLAALTFVGATGFILVYLARWCRRREWLLLTATLINAFASFDGIQGVERVQLGYESSIQVNAGLTRWELPALGYHDYAFIHYNARQYLLVSVPALFGGRTLLNLRLGYALIFFLSFVFFLVGLYRFWNPDGKNGKNSSAGIFAGLSGLAVLAFPVVLLFLKYYEQTILPLSFTLLSMGWFFLWWRNSSRWLLLPLAWSAGMLATTYTPGLSSWILSLLIFAALFWQTSRQHSTRRAELAALFIYTAAIGIVSIFVLGHWLPARLVMGSTTPAGVFSQTDLWSRISAGLPALLVNGQRPFITPLLVIPFFVQFFFCLIRPLKGRGFLFSAIWIWAVVSLIAALCMRGWRQRPPSFDLHRAIIIVPPLVFCVVDFWRTFLRQNFVRWRWAAQVFGLLLAATIVPVLWTTRDIVSLAPYEPTAEELLALRIADFAQSLPGGQPLRVYVSPDAPVRAGMNNALGYFAPDVVVLRRNPNFDLLRSRHLPFMAVCSETTFTAQKSATADLNYSFLPQDLASTAKEAFVVVQQK